MLVAVSEIRGSKAKENTRNVLLLFSHNVALVTIEVQTCKSAYWRFRQPACFQQWKGSISNPMASTPSHLIHPMGERSIQILKLSGGCVCLFSKEQNRKTERERKCLQCYPTRNHSNWATGHWGRLLSVCQLMGLCSICSFFRLIPDTDCEQHKERWLQQKMRFLAMR